MLVTAIWAIVLYVGIGVTMIWNAAVGILTVSDRASSDNP
jgi:hypothetical protein